LASQISSSSEIPRIFSKLYRDPTQINFLNFYSRSISNLDKFLWEKLFLTSSSFHPYFIWNFWSQLGPPFDEIILNYFKLIQINPKPYCSCGLDHPAFFLGRPTRARTPPTPLRSRYHRGPPGRSGPGPTTPSRAVWHFRGRTPLSFLSLSAAPTTAPLKA
jgi:hypothetical protein